MNIIITGGAGFIGSHLTEQLLKRGDKILCIDDFNDYYDPELKKENVSPFLKNRNYKLVKADVQNMDAVKKAFDEFKPERVVHLAARVGVRPSINEPELYMDVNVKGTLNILELCRDHKVKNLVFASSSSVYGANTKIPFSEEDKTDRQISPYGTTKKAGELLCYTYHSLYKMNITCLRFFTVYGERGRPDMALLKFTSLISEGKEIDMYGDGKTKRDYTYVGDLVAGVIAAIDRELGYEIINLGNNDPIELTKLITTIEKQVGKKAKIKQMPMQGGDVPLTYADITKAKRLLGYAPKVKIEEGIKRLVEWYKRKQ